MRLLWSVVILLLLSTSVLGVDEFLEAESVDRIADLPGEFMAICKAETTAGLDYIETKIDARLESLPILIGLSAGIGVLAGLIMGTLFNMVMLKRLEMMRNKQIKKLTDSLREFNRIMGVK